MDWSELLSTRRDRLSKRPARDTRSEFERDYDRAIFSTPVRRLHDKAQVFPLEPLDAVRTRLTHSLEVSTIARDLGDAVGKQLFKEGRLKNIEQAADIRALAATCALIHDLGNPPFGHAGEHAIREWFERHGRPDPDRRADPGLLAPFGGTSEAIEKSQYAQDFLRFEGNAQTMRLVSRLQVLADQHGLNLTYGTLSAGQKYVARSNALNQDFKECKKPGHFASENGLIARIREATGTGEARNPISYLVEACDDMAYLVVDLEDGIKKRVIDWGTLKEELKRAATECTLVKQCIGAAEQQIDQGTAKLFGPDRDEAYGVAFRIQSIARMVPAVREAFFSNYDSIMGGGFHESLLRSGSAGAFAEACRTVCERYVYCSTETLRLEILGRRVIQDLMDIFWQGVRDWKPGKPPQGFAKTIYELLSPNYRTVFEHSAREAKLPETYSKLQLVTDYVAGMTDTFACTLHRRLTNG